MDKSLENYFLKSEVTTFEGNIRLISLLINDNGSWIKQSAYYSIASCLSTYY